MSWLSLVAAVDAHAHLGRHFSGPHADYVGVALAAFVSWAGFTGPGEAALIAAGIAAAHNRVDIGGMLAAGWAGAMLGGVTGWLAGLKGGRALVTAPGPLYRLRLRLLAHGDALYERRGLLAVYFAPSWMAGISGMRASRFLPANAISTLIWTLLVGLGSYWAGPPIVDVLSDIGIVGVGIVVVVVVLTVLAQRRRRSRRGRGQNLNGT
jgi:membrane protein DedA with SNARE-associated domain